MFHIHYNITVLLIINANIELEKFNIYCRYRPIHIYTIPTHFMSRITHNRTLCIRLWKSLFIQINQIIYTFLILYGLDLFLHIRLLLIIIILYNIFSIANTFEN